MRYICFLSMIMLILATSCDNQVKENDLKKENLSGRVKSVKEAHYGADEKFGEVIKKEKHKQVDFYFNEDGFFLENMSKSYLTEISSFDNTTRETFKYNKEGKIIRKSFFSDFFSESETLTSYKYDDRGNLIEEKANKVTGELLSRDTYTYDDRNNKIEEKIMNSKEKVLWKRVFKYDSKGNNIEKTEYNSDGELDSKNIYKYDDRNNLIEESEYNSDGNLENKNVFKFDIKGNLIEEFTYDSEGMQENKAILKYDEKNNNVEEKKYYSDNSLKMLGDYKYDKSGGLRKSQISWYNLEGKLTSSYNSEYDEKGNELINETKKVKNSPEFLNLLILGDVNNREVRIYYDTDDKRIRKTFDENNNMIEEVIYTGYLLGDEIKYKGNMETKYIFELDNRKNWIKKIGLDNENKTWLVVERELEYYD